MSDHVLIPTLIDPPAAKILNPAVIEVADVGNSVYLRWPSGCRQRIESYMHQPEKLASILREWLDIHLPRPPKEEGPAGMLPTFRSWYELNPDVVDVAEGNVRIWFPYGNWRVIDVHRKPDELASILREWLAAHLMAVGALEQE